MLKRKLSQPFRSYQCTPDKGLTVKFSTEEEALKASELLKESTSSFEIVTEGKVVVV